MTRSISARLVFGATLWCLIVVLVTGALLVRLFGGHIEAQFDANLENDLLALVARSELRQGRLRVEQVAMDSRYNQPFSGWVWQVRDGDRVLAQSGSLGPAVAGFAEPVAAPADTVARFNGPGDAAARGMARLIQLKETSRSFTFVIARPADDIIAALVDFRQVVLFTLAVMLAGLVLTVYVLMRIGLMPLRDLRRKVAAMRQGKTLAHATWPRELAPVAAELDALQADTDRIVTRARSSAADLAHAVKTPLATLHYLARDVADEGRDTMAQQLRRIDDHLDRYLSRSRSAGTGTQEVKIADIAEDIVSALAPLHSALSMHVDVDSDAVLRGDEGDVYEVLGALIDNATKWAKCRVEVRGRRDGPRVVLDVLDDGPGIPEAARTAVLERGNRLDESRPGQGLGLSIAGDIARLYGGNLELGGSSLGGCRATIHLPATAP